MAPSALSGIRIADFSRILSGPFATMVLADLGAEVIKIERPEGDDTRAWGPPYDDSGAATYFLAANRNKTSLVADLSAEGERARVRELVAGCDVVVENFRPGVMERLGMDWATLSAADPRLVYCSITAFGAGAGAALPGYDLVLQAVGGLMSITGSPDGEPQKVGVAVVDVIAGLFAAVGILAALRHREATGQGQLVEVDMLSALLSALVNQATAHTAGGVVAGRMGNVHPSIAPYEVLATGAGEVAVAVGNGRQFAALGDVLGLPGLAGDPRFATNADRVAHRPELRAALEAALAADTAPAWVARLSAAGVPAGAVNDIGAAFALAEQLGLAPTVAIPREGAGPAVVPRNPIRMSVTPPRYDLPPPALGSAGPARSWPDRPGAGPVVTVRP